MTLNAKQVDLLKLLRSAGPRGLKTLIQNTGMSEHVLELNLQYLTLHAFIELQGMRYVLALRGQQYLDSLPPVAPGVHYCNGSNTEPYKQMWAPPARAGASRAFELPSKGTEQ